MPNDEAPNSLRTILCALGVLVICFLFLWGLFVISELSNYFNLIIDLGYDGAGLFLLLVFGVIGWYISLLFMCFAWEDLTEPKTQSELKYIKKRREIKKKYHSEEVRKLKLKEARAEWKLEEARNALKELK